MEDAYRRAEVRAEASAIRYSPWLVAMWLLSVVVSIGFTVVLFAYVARGWIGYAVAGCVALYALFTLRGYRRARVSECPRCGTPIDLPAPGFGYLCSCQTFLETERDMLIASKETRVAETAVFGVDKAGSLQLPALCCVCMKPSTRLLAASGSTIGVPHCDEHERGATLDKDVIRFRSLAYATRVREANDGTFVGRTSSDKPEPRWSAFGSAALMLALAAGAYFGLGWIENSDYIIVPASLKGLVLWLLIVLVGRTWIAIALVAGALMAYGTFVASFRPARRSARPGS